MFKKIIAMFIRFKFVLAYLKKGAFYGHIPSDAKYLECWVKYILTGTYPEDDIND